MQPSLFPPPKTTSVFDAIKDGDWEGLLMLYATTACDAVRSADFARRGTDLRHQEFSSNSRRGVFCDGEDEAYIFAWSQTYSMQLRYNTTCSTLQRKKLKDFILMPYSRTSPYRPFTSLIV